MSEFVSDVLSWVWTIVVAAAFVVGLPYVSFMTNIPNMLLIIIGVILFFAFELGGLFLIGHFTEYECCTEHL